MTASNGGFPQVRGLRTVLGMEPGHAADHKLLADSIATDHEWTHARLLVHLAREHGLRVEDVDNAGLARLIPMHNQSHDPTSA